MVKNDISAQNAEKKIIDIQKDLTWLVKFAKKLRTEKFFGKVELVYQNGKIVNCIRNESLIPE